MDVAITDTSPGHEAVHIDISGRDAAPECGVMLTLTAPDEIIAAVKAAARHRCDWVVHHLDVMPCSERRAAAFVVQMARRARGRVWVVLADGSGRAQRIAGHLLRAGAVAHRATDR